MKHLFDVKYVGDDSHTHSKRVWAENASDARKKVKGSSVDYVLHVRKRNNPFVGVVFFIVIAFLIVAFAYLGMMIARGRA